VLSIDATSASRHAPCEIEALRAADFGGARGWTIPRMTEYFGRFLRHGNAWPERQIRLYDRRAAHWSGYEVHEKIAVSGPVGALGAISSILPTAVSTISWAGSIATPR